MRAPTAEHCLTMASEAERLASIVSYSRDKTRLTQQAQDWREQAAALSEAAPVAADVSPKSATVAARAIAWMRALRPTSDRHPAGRLRLPLKRLHFGRTAA